jgi:Tol biopolymer transport system component
MDADGNSVVQLTDNAVTDMGAGWSPDGTQLVFYSDRDGDFEIYIMDLE